MPQQSHWSFEPEEYAPNLVRDSEGKIVAVVPGDSAEAEDRARLIAAAPTLLEALERIAAPLDCGCVPCRGQCRSQSALEIELEERQDLARAAILSARGAGV